MAEMSLESGVHMLRRRANAVMMAIFVYVFAWAFVVVGNLLESTGRIDMVGETVDVLTGVFALAYVGSFFVFLVSAVVVCMWIYRAHANLDAADMTSGETPGWAVGSFFVPFLNLYKPFQAMRGLWFASQGYKWQDGDGTPAAIGWWWGTWLVGNGLANVGTGMSTRGDVAGGGLIGAFSAALLICSALLLLRIVREITEAQAGGSFTAEVFA